jgi:hypothetical protein
MNIQNEIYDFAYEYSGSSVENLVWRLCCNSAGSPAWAAEVAILLISPVSDSWDNHVRETIKEYEY